MIVDSSALVATLLAEPAHEVLIDRLASAAVVGVGASTLAETGIVLTARIGVAAGHCSLGCSTRRISRLSRARRRTGPSQSMRSRATARDGTQPL